MRVPLKFRLYRELLYPLRVTETLCERAGKERMGAIVRWVYDRIYEKLTQ